MACWKKKLASDVTYYYVHFKMNVVQGKIMTIESYKKEYLQENYHTGYKEEENTLLWFPKFFISDRKSFPNIILSLEDIIFVMKKQNRFYKVQAGGPYAFMAGIIPDIRKRVFRWVLIRGQR